MPLSLPGFAASYFKFSRRRRRRRRWRRVRGVSVCAASPLAKTPRYQPVISRKSISLLNESPIKRNELLVQSRFSTVDFRARFQCTLPPSPPRPARLPRRLPPGGIPRSFDDRIQKACRNSSMAIRPGLSVRTSSPSASPICAATPRPCFPTARPILFASCAIVLFPAVLPASF
jgi:hypothetical protein